ncbi:putative MAPEG superfamily protein related to glutathione S-transferase precursor [Sphingobium herbicidovorans NBRC 16415]|uniref:MAPEG superfamily protein related to glutathione S-transferase n=1 Tax=Sphingobium herbicidovorans (strain ATCC 700291 / DSM 11019 / CCUG 56400 / KCTC 2939 / LMG 18315 / NBRC 16415 / MH) TaxID=1219045 RepID=A0A086P9X2_SPHHM|nr:putative MAPEG superfamily protein related to glutathione S-transferase precursor [Sphingobium herbicidovorans NBRC 16415]
MASAYCAGEEKDLGGDIHVVADHADPGCRVRAAQPVACLSLRPDSGGQQDIARRWRQSAAGAADKGACELHEYTPIVLILFALVELAIGSPLWLWIGALVYVVARAAHGIGMDADRPTVWRAGGALLSWAVTAALAATALYVAYHATRAVPAPPAMAAR